MSENEFETICMIIEHLEVVEEMAWKKFSYYFDNKIHDKANVYEGLSCRINLEIQALENFMRYYDIRKGSK